MSKKLFTAPAINPNILIISCGQEYMDYKWFGYCYFKKNLVHSHEGCSIMVGQCGSGICSMFLFLALCAESARGK